MLLGAHVSIAGGVSNAPLRAEKIGCETFQIFTKNQMQWRIPKLTDEELKKYYSNLHKTEVIPGTVHASYLVNIASPNEKTLRLSILNLAEDLERAELLGIKYLVFHPGAHKGKGETYALDMIVKSINNVFKITKSEKVSLLLETTAGEGTNVGYKLEHIAYIIGNVKSSDRLGVCVDTCHIFAAGYDIRNKDAYNKFFYKFDSLIGLKRLKAFHLNDSKRELGSHMDRHEEIGKGKIGVEAFRLLVNDGRFKSVFGILETPGGEEGYKRNLDLLKSLRR